MMQFYQLRILSKFSKDNENLKLNWWNYGMNEVLDQAGVQNVANLPTLDEATSKNSRYFECALHQSL